MPNIPKKFKILDVDCEILVTEGDRESVMQGSYTAQNGILLIDPVSIAHKDGATTQQLDKKIDKAIAAVIKLLGDAISNVPKDPQQGHSRVYWYLHNKVN